MHQFVLLLAMVMVVPASTIAQTHTSIPQADQNGDYAHNEAPIQGTVPPGSRLMAGSLWQVVSPRLNCRQRPGTSSPVVRQFQAGDRLQAEVGRGGSDEVLINARDAAGKPWMGVRSKTFKLEDACYVRANHRYIRPITRHPVSSRSTR